MAAVSQYAGEECMLVLLRGSQGDCSTFVNSLQQEPFANFNDGNTEEPSRRLADGAIDIMIGSMRMSILDGTNIELSEVAGVHGLVMKLLKRMDAGVRLLGIIWLHDVSRHVSMNVTKERLRVLKLLLGCENHHHILLVTTGWSNKDFKQNKIEEDRQHILEDQYWDRLLADGAELHRFDGSGESARAIISQLNFKDKISLAIHDEVSNGVPIQNTTLLKFLTGKSGNQPVSDAIVTKSPEKSTAIKTTTITKTANNANDTYQDSSKPLSANYNTYVPPTGSTTSTTTQAAEKEEKPLLARAKKRLSINPFRRTK